ncbi:MAG: 50S ribosomal protein L18 [Deltaproteobacteria bacterium]|nr:50S ribosomal protein L18 [Deltaproteobacteria bacterium]
MNKRTQGREYRQERIRKKIAGTAGRPRLSIFMSLKHIYAQIINDELGSTLASASTMEKKVNAGKKSVTIEGAKKIGEQVAERALAKGITQVVFDRSGYRYHGRVRAMAEAAREKGLQF